MKDLKMLLYYAGQVKRYKEQISELDKLIEEIDHPWCEDEDFEKALGILLANNRYLDIYEIFIEKLKEIKDDRERRLAEALSSLKKTINEEDGQ